MVAINDHLEVDFEAIEAQERRVSGTGILPSVIAILISAIWLVPYYYLLVSVFKSSDQYAQSHPLSPPVSIWPLVDNVIHVWTNTKLSVGLLNSAIYGVLGAGFAVLFASMAAYGLTRFNFKRKNLWFMLIFAGTVFPLQMYLIPLFFIYNFSGLLNTHLGMLLFYTAICIPFPTLIIRTYMAGITREVDEAARMEGASELTIFFRILLPQCWGPVAATFLLQFTWIWNDLLFSMVLGNRAEIQSVMNSLVVLRGLYSENGPTSVLTGALMASVPTVLLFVFLRKMFMSGLSVGTR